MIEVKMPEPENPYPELIDSFDGEYRFLSNFWPAEVEFEGIKFPSVENAYQAAKTLDLEERKRLAAMTSGQAKKAGKKLEIRPDWESVKVAVMENLVWQKFQNAELMAKLKATGEKPLIEGNWWGDTFWGICRGKGKNELGRILMQVRMGVKPFS